MACNRPHQTPHSLGNSPCLPYLICQQVVPPGKTLGHFCLPSSVIWSNTAVDMKGDHSCLFFFFLNPHQESMGFIWCLILILKDVVWLGKVTDWAHPPQTMIFQHALSERGHRSQSYVSKPIVGYGSACHWLWQLQDSLWVWVLGSCNLREGGVGSKAFA